jgi:hypothetical protein
MYVIKHIVDLFANIQYIRQILERLENIDTFRNFSYIMDNDENKCIMH